MTIGAVGAAGSPGFSLRNYLLVAQGPIASALHWSFTSWKVSSTFSCSLPSEPLTTCLKIFVHDDVAGLRIDHDRPRALRTSSPEAI